MITTGIIIKGFMIAFTLLLMWFSIRRSFRSAIRKAEERAIANIRVANNLPPGNPSYFGSAGAALFDKYKDRLGKLLGMSPGSLVMSYADNQTNTHFTIFNSSKQQLKVASFTLTPFPGCCAFVVSTAACTYYPFEGKGVGTLMNQFRCELAYQLGYTGLICTDVERNAPQKKILTKNKWHDVYQVTNRRTNNVVNLSVKHLSQCQYQVNPLLVEDNEQTESEEHVHSSSCRAVRDDSSQPPSQTSRETTEPSIASIEELQNLDTFR